MKNYILLTFLLLIGSIGNQLQAADAPTLNAEAPKQVVIGQNFRLVYTSNEEVDELRIPELSSFFDILYGPSTTMSSSTTIRNGKYESVTEFGVTYILQPKKVGTFTIPAASGSVGNKAVRSNTLSITVLPSDKQPAANNSTNRSPEKTTNNNQVSNEQIFIRAIPSKTKVKEQEGLLVTYKLYTRVDISSMQNPKFPEFQGFMAQEVPRPNNPQWEMENYNGLNYNTAIIRQTVLYPQKTGQLNIDKGSFDFVIQVRNQTKSRSIFDDFFDNYSEVKKTIYCNSIHIQVSPLPAGKPANFSGVVGQLAMTSKISSNKIKANEAVTIQLKISGNGNMKMIPTPEITFPADFEAYDPKINNAFKVSASGQSGTKTIEYLVIPRFPGTFEIPSVSIGYFDTKSNTYKVLSTPVFKLEVGKGSGSSGSSNSSFVNQEQLKMVGSDIRYLKKITHIDRASNMIFGSVIYWLSFIIPLLLVFIILIINRKKLKENADIAKVRNRKANRVAVKRLKSAHLFMQQNNQEAFYEEILKALWGYTSDKLDIPNSLLNKENIESQLTSAKVSQDIRNAYMEILDSCEFARFAPGDPMENMDHLYEKTVDVINKMESTLKR